MSKKPIVISSCVAVLLAGVFSVGRNTFSRAVQHDLPPHAQPSQQGPIVSDHAVYNSLFRKVVRLREKTRELQAQGHVGQKPYFPVQREAGLSEGQASALEAIAFACRQQVAQQDEKAKVIIKAFQTRFPGGKVPEGGSPPPPPPELRTMWEERNAMILSARDQLRIAFGDEQFARFDNYAKFHYGKNLSPITIDPVRPKSK